MARIKTEQSTSDRAAILSFPPFESGGIDSDNHTPPTPPPNSSAPPAPDNVIESDVPQAPTTVTGFPNKRISWAERRRSRTRPATRDLDQQENPSGFQYEEFMKDSVPCPTCGGAGCIDRETESKLVALIPYDDDRLKPRRTLPAVAVGVFVAVLVAGLTLFFLFPRSVQLISEKKRLTPVHVNIVTNSTNPSVFLTIQNEFIVENSNYVPVTFESLSMHVTVFDQNLNNTVNNTQVLIPIRSRVRVYARTDLYFRNALSFIAPYCADPREWMHTFLFKFDISAQASFMRHSQDMTLSVFQYVSCGKISSEIEDGTTYNGFTEPRHGSAH